MYSLKEAAEAVGMGKPGILKAIQNGRISARKDDFGRWEIDPAELHRVYKPVFKEPQQRTGFERQEAQETVNDTRELVAKLDAMGEIKARLEDECGDLRRRLDHAEEARTKAEEAKDKAFSELSRLTLMLTDQREKEAATAEKQKRGLFSWFRRAG